MDGKTSVATYDVLCAKSIYTVKAPNVAHLSILTSVRYNKKETNLKKNHS